MGFAPLHFAAISENQTILTNLLEHGADVDLQDDVLIFFFFCLFLRNRESNPIVLKNNFNFNFVDLFIRKDFPLFMWLLTIALKELWKFWLNTELRLIFKTKYFVFI